MTLAREEESTSGVQKQERPTSSENKIITEWNMFHSSTMCNSSLTVLRIALVLYNVVVTEQQDARKKAHIFIFVANTLLLSTIDYYAL